ncbi:MAG: hypothetical protein SAJ12_00540 [Jaaginema sp. PMC 1079.18]|nr:hypothetical protein [Jaaginema sp. PMC 1080.18]MEC4849470.1 hypothetical protein [Jaaginema sp. PMC 1079.18]MEC4866026.1 hypothetical protein [Jaaginema sp. PMC 1078.18]
MNNLPPHTVRRLNKLPQSSSIWEGDRRSLGGMAAEIDLEAPPAENDCVIWVDNSEGVVRSMEIVSPDIGSQAMVRALVKAMESPQSQVLPSRPYKILVRDRELHFLLRGMLAPLQIETDYIRELPLIDELFRSFEHFRQTQLPQIPAIYSERLQASAVSLWEIAPWRELADHQIIAIHLNTRDIETLYVSIMGLLGEEYGILMYRSLESLENFRATVLNEDSEINIEEAFLLQDCWFLNYEVPTAEAVFSEAETSPKILPLFGSLHPLEGIRPFLDSEEALIVLLALEALKEFLQDWQGQPFPVRAAFEDYQKQYSIPVPASSDLHEVLAVEVATCPDLASEFLAMIEDEEFDLEEDDSESMPPLHYDIVPDDALLMLRTVNPQERQKLRRQSKTNYIVAAPDNITLPMLWIQTSRPKAQKIIASLKKCAGLKGLCLNPGEDTSTGSYFDLALLQAFDESLYLLAEFECDRLDYTEQRQNWDRCSQKSQGYCAIAISMGVTGSHRGKFRIQDAIALYELPIVSPKALGIGTLELVSQFSGFEIEF